MKKISSYLLTLVFVVVAVVATHAQAPRRIISLAPSLTKNLYLLGAGDLLVGCTSYCTLQSDTQAEVVASAIQVNYEKAVLLQPDLVITTSLTKPKTIDTFRKLGVEVLVYDSPRSFEEICSQFIDLGEQVGRKQQAETLIADAKARMKQTLERIPADAPSQKIILQIGANPLFSVVPNTFMNDFIRFSKTENIAADLTVGSITRESVLIRNPDIIVVVLMGMIGEEEKSQWMSYPSLSAVQKNQIFMMDADKACSPTPLSFVESLEDLITKIYQR
ncbi:helical backbone metal receptor [uncultured Sunxiuqinia sp.]|uniref:ABC transporter substrate-binding protein n=1 Tax=uncultured Sunxiuqinia sp. TaxID=1573825 RepID=UPI00262EA667|nr:helical backbone metal receptor [uncultured Sunxiuqinia sp.]